MKWFALAALAVCVALAGSFLVARSPDRGQAKQETELASRFLGPESQEPVPAPALAPVPEIANAYGIAGPAESGVNSSVFSEPMRFDDAKDRPKERSAAPERFLPRAGYFGNTYLGGNAAFSAWIERLDRAFGEGPPPYHLAYIPPQGFDEPTASGLSLTASLDRATLNEPGSVFLQIGLRGSDRFGWRRPPLDVALVVDHEVLARGPQPVVASVRHLLEALLPQDRLGVFLSGASTIVLAEVGSTAEIAYAADARLDSLDVPPSGDAFALGDTLLFAGARLQAAAQNQARIPGSQTIILLTTGRDAQRIEGARQAANTMTLQGAVTSVIELGVTVDAPWWDVAAAGHGNYHRVLGARPEPALDDELSSLSRVVARLVRINIRLGPHTQAVRILGSEMLGERQVQQVKARELATDRNLSRTLGVKADRGDDDDGLQTLIPYFYGGDAHVIIVELWVDEPGAVAEVSLKYKDMVNLDNASARTSVQLERGQQAPTLEADLVLANLRGFELAERLGHASREGNRGDHAAMQAALDEARGFASTTADAQLIAAFDSLASRGGAEALLGAAFQAAAQRRLGFSRR